MNNSLGLPEFNVLSVDEDTDGRSFVYNVTLNKDPLYLCLGCFTKRPYKHGTTQRIIQDMPVQGKLVYIKATIQRYKCRNCGMTHTDFMSCVDEKNRMTKRLREHIKERCLVDTFTRIAQDLSLSISTVRRIFAEYVKESEKLLKFKAPRVMGIDEAHLNKLMRCVITDTENNMLLELLPDREAPTIKAFIKSLNDAENIKIVTMDMYAPYKAVISKALPSAKIVVDKFHVVQLAVRKMDEVRRDIRRSLPKPEQRSMTYIANLMKANSEDLDVAGRDRLMSVINTYKQLGQAYLLKEKIRRLYSFSSRIDAGRFFEEWCQEAAEYDLEPFNTAADTYKSWAREIFNYFDHPYTNAYTEAANNLIKKLDKDGRSLSFEQLRYKVLFSTKATKTPKFEMKNATYKPSNTMSMMTTGFTFDDHKPKLLSGFGVDISELLSQ